MRQVRDENLRLTGNNKDDLKVISAYLQDSLIAVRDIVFLKKNKTFIMIANRFMWEDIEKGIFRQNKRIRCAIKFETVLSVKSKNIHEYNWEFPCCYILGNEVSGVSDQLLNMAEDHVEIPMFGIKQSLNVSVAGGVIGYEVARVYHSQYGLNL